MSTRSVRLSERLQFIFENLLSQYDVWDICCDHGLIGQAAWQSRNFKNIHFVDQVPHLIEDLKNKVPSESTIFFQCLSGENISENVFGNVVITGVGADTILKILISLQKADYLKAERLILGPHRDTDKLVEQMQSHQILKNYTLMVRKELMEKGRLRVFFIFDRVNSTVN